MVNPIPKSQESKTYSTQVQAWKWEQKHWLLVIAVVCLMLFWFGSNMLEVSLVKKAVDWLPVIGTVAFASEKIIKLAQ